MQSAPVRFVSRYVLSNPLLPSAMALACVAVGMLAQFSQPLNADLGWLLVATERFVDGAATHGRDLFEWNQPMMLWLLSPGVLVARAIDHPSLDVITCTRLYLSCFGLFGLWFFWRISRRALLSPHPLVPRYLLAALAYALFVFPGRDFGQQEHLTAVLMLPNVLLVAAHAGKRKVGRRVSFFTGMAVGVAVCIKPHLILVVAAWEVYLLFRRRRIAYWWRADVAGMVLVGFLYVASLLIMTPGYVGLVIPLVVDTYWVYQVPVSSLVDRLDVALLAGSALVIPVVCIGAPYRVVGDEDQEEVETDGRHQRRDLLEYALALVLSALAFYAVGLAQATGWAHHMLPFEISLLLAYASGAIHGMAWLVSRIEEPDGAPESRSFQEVVGLALAAAFAALYVVAPTSAGEAIRQGGVWRAGGVTGGVQELASFIEEHAGGEAVYVVSPTIDGVFPAINYAHVEWTSRFPALYLPAVIRRYRREDPMIPSHLTAARVAEIERFTRDAVLEDMERRPPRLILVDTEPDAAIFAGEPVDYLAYLLEDPEFAERWAGYEPIGRVGRFLAAVRRSP